ncbi:hypothetical protein V6N13_091118 [Hibiscus sabdariffa]
MHSVSSRICFTCDGWSACTSRSYFALAAHYVDNNWKLQYKILNFRRFPPPHDGESIYKFVKKLLCEWGLEKKAFTITLDNASANDKMVKRLKDDLHAISPPPSMQCFELAVKDCGSSFSGKLILDVPTRWNSTYSMLRREIEAKVAINMFTNRESDLDLITEDEWETAHLICDFLEPFYEITTLFSGFKYPTSNLYLANVVSIEKLLCDAHKDPCEGISSMAGLMLELYEKYCVLYVEDEVERRVSLVYTEFVNLYVYYSKSVLCSSSNSSVQSNSTHSSSLSSSSRPRTFKKSNLFQKFDANLAASRSGKSDVDSYMNLPLLSCIEDSQFDVLDYWKSQTISFPHGGRILNKLRAKLLPKNVEIFVTTRNWLYGFEPEERDEDYLSVLKDSHVTDLAEE